MSVRQALVAQKRVRKPAREDSVSALTVTQRFQYGTLVILWAVVVAYFTRFWFSVPRIDSWLFAIPITIALFYESIIVVSCYLFFLGQMRIPKHIPAPPGRRVAIISPCVPSKESVAIIERQIRGMVAVTYPHDTWILDEEDDPQVAALCRRYGARHFSRKGVAAWNQPGAPFQAKTKAGNVNAWLFEHGVAYDFFVQMDIDHCPVPHYLDRTLGHFLDPRVAWVQAPSVYSNLDGLAARGSAEQSRLLHGPLQMGLYGFCHTPMIIGSHTTYRTSALLAIGGMQPTRAEDHLDTVVFSQHGYIGVFVPERIATGDGPENFETYLAQEYAWAYSMAQILFQYSYKNLRRYPLRTIPAFLFTQTWYPLWSFSLLALFITPPLMLLLNQSVMAVPLPEFLRYYVPLQLCATGICWWSSRWFQPAGLGLGWRCIILNVARWPVLCWAIFQALVKIKKPYMITPKGLAQREIPPFNFRAQRPYLTFIAISLASVWWYLQNDQRGSTQGNLLYVLLGAIFMLGVFWTAVVQDIAQLRQRGMAWLRAFGARLRPLSLGMLLLLSLAYTVWGSAPRVLETARWTGDELPVVAASSPIQASPSPGSASASPTPVPQGQAVPAAPATSTPTEPPCPPGRQPITLGQPFFGAYDPRRQLLDDSFQVEAFYIDLSSDAAIDALPARLGQVYRADRIPMVTIEPWQLSQSGPLGGPDRGDTAVLVEIAEGYYDRQLRRIAIALHDCGGPILLRFGQEMEIPELYPWYSDQPERYIDAYRHVYQLFAASGSRDVRWIWSPAGNFTAERYYPGDDVVDYVGFTLLGSHEFDILSGTWQRRTFTQLMEEKFARMQALGKPLIIAEMGISGSPELQLGWLREMFDSLGQYPEVEGVIYYNDFNAINRLVSDPPDYSITARQWRDSGGSSAPPPARPGRAPAATPSASPAPPLSRATQPAPPAEMAIPAAMVLPAATVPPTPVLPPRATAEPPTPTLPFPATDRIGAPVPVNLRVGPGSNFATLGAVPPGTLLAATGDSAYSDGFTWRRFRLDDGRVGWVRQVDVIALSP